MRLRRLTVEGLAQLQHVELPFRDDAPNVILGPNESGKSHLMRALFAMFFPLEQAEDLIPWSGQPAMRGLLDFSDDGGRLVRLERNLLGPEVEVFTAGAESWKGRVKGSTPEAERFAACLQRWLGFRASELFTATTFVRQADVILQGTAQQRRDLAGQIKALITGTQETSYESVLATLHQQLDGLERRRGQRKDRELERTRAALSQARQEYQAAAEKHDRFAGLSHRLTVLERDLTAQRAEGEQIASRLRSVGALDALERRSSEHDETFQRLEQELHRKYEYQAKLEAARAVTLRLQPFAGLEEVHLREMQRDLEEARREEARLAGAAIPLEDLTRLDTNLHAARQAVALLPPWPEDVPIDLLRRTGGAPATSAWLLAGGLVLAGLILGILLQPAFLSLIGLAAFLLFALVRRQGQSGALLGRIGVGSVAEAEERWRVRQEAVTRLDRAQAELDELLRRAGVASVEQAVAREAERAAAEQLLAGRQRACNALLDRIGVGSVAEALCECARFGEARREVDIQEAALQALGSEEALRAEHARAGSERAALAFERQQLLATAPELQALTSADTRAAYIRQQEERRTAVAAQLAALEQALQETRRAHAELGQERAEDIPVLYSHLQELETELARKERLAEALKIATTELEAAVATFRDHCLGEVMRDTSSFLQAMTAGRYTQVEIEAETLVPTVITPERAVAVPQLSRGVQDQLYFAIRVALARAITAGRTLPLVLDDPFVNFDPVRREQALMLLRGLVDHTQVILFTCDPWYAERIQPVLELAPAGLSQAPGAIEVA